MEDTVRPHEALGQRPPADLYRPSPRVFPNRLLPIEYPSEAQVRSVRQNGEIKWAGRALFVSEVLAGEHIALWQSEHGWDL